MRRAAAITVLLLALLPVAIAGAAPKIRAHLPDIEDEVMCVECGTALNVSQAPSADRERALIRRLIARGMTKPQIKAELAAEYGPNVLGEPPDRGFNIAVWLVPVVLAAAAIAGVWTTVRRWRRVTDSEREAAGDTGDGLDADDRRRLERDMAGYDL